MEGKYYITYTFKRKCKGKERKGKGSYTMINTEHKSDREIVHELEDYVTRIERMEGTLRPTLTGIFKL